MKEIDVKICGQKNNNLISFQQCFNVQLFDVHCLCGFLWVGSSGYWISLPSKFGSSEVLCLCALSCGNTDVVLGSF